MTVSPSLDLSDLLYLRTFAAHVLPTQLQGFDREREREGGQERHRGHKCVCATVCMRVCFIEAKGCRGGKRVPEGDHPGRRGGGRRTGRGKVRLMMLG